MKKSHKTIYRIISIILLSCSVSIQAQSLIEDESESQYGKCTNIMVGRLAIINWSMGRKLIEPAVKEFEDKAFGELPLVEEKVAELISAGKKEEAKQYITTYTNNFAYSAMKKWEEMKTPLWSMYSSGF